MDTAQPSASLEGRQQPRQLDRLFYQGGEYVRADEAIKTVVALRSALWNLVFYIANCDDEQMPPRLRQRVDEARNALRDEAVTAFFQAAEGCGPSSHSTPHKESGI